MKAAPHTPDRPEGALTAVKALLEIIIAALFVVTFIVQPSRIPSESMIPTLRVGDFLLIDKQSYGPTGVLDRVMPPAAVKRGDLVVFHYPVDGTIHLVKRVVGLPGDRIRLRDGRVLLNEQALGEPYAFYSDTRPNGFRDYFPSLREADPNVDPDWWLEMRRTVRAGEVTVPPNHYFVLGDNRNDSEDSRYWGFVPRDAIVGRPLFVYFTMRSDEATDRSLLTRFRESLHAGAKSWRVLR